MNAHGDLVLARLGVGQVGQGESTDAGIAVSNGYGLHDTIPSVERAQAWASAPLTPHVSDSR
jgi:hypothetical protein